MVPAAVVLVAVLVFVLPVVRARLRHGTWAVVVHRSTDPVQRFVGRAFGWTVAAVALWTVAYVVLGPRTLGVVEPPRWVTAAGWCVYAGSVALVVGAQATMGPSWRIGIDERPTDMVAHGIYRWVRHPIYAGIVALAVALALLAPSPWTLLAVPMVAFEVGLQARLEEQHLERLHGDAWRAYAARTGRFLPKLG